MTMLSVKIPAPSLTKIEAFVDANNLDKANVLERYMTILSDYIELASDSKLVYEDAEITSSHIIAKVKLGSLPAYKDMEARYHSVDFKGELIKRINQARAVYNDGCPEPDNLLLTQPLTTWHHRWVTAYIWVLVCCADQPKHFPTDKSVVELLFKRLEFAEIY